MEGLSVNTHILLLFQLNPWDRWLLLRSCNRMVLKIQSMLLQVYRFMNQLRNCALHIVVF